VEKFYNAYEESIYWGQEMHSLISVLDIVPTIANLLGVSGAFESCFYGTSLVKVLDNPGTCPNEMVHFTYSCNAPTIIWCVRTLRYKYAVYFTSDGNNANWELYDLQLDPDEDYNVAGQARYGNIQLEL
jgi:arylsulfatase A-like enzyme